MAQSNRDDRLTGSIIVVALVSAISGLLYGYDTGIISGALLQIGKDFDIGHLWEQVIAASILVGAVIGALTCSRLAERRGRHGTLLLIGIVFVVGTIAAAFSPDPITLSLSRLVLGFAVGGATQTAPVYVAELAPTAHRGRLVLFFQIAIGVGIVIATIVGATEVIDWRIAIGLAAVPAAIMFFLMLRLPESPRWLAREGHVDRARESLARVRHPDSDLSAEFDEIQQNVRDEKQASTRGWSGLKAAWVRPALVVGCGLAIFTQLSGIEMIVYYTPTILTDNGFSDSTALRVSVALGLTYLIAQLIGLAIIDRVGRRRLTLVTLPCAALALIVLGSFFVTGNDGKIDDPLDHRHPHRLHGVHRRRDPAHGLADRLRDLPAGHPRGRCRGAVRVAVGNKRADHAVAAQHHEGDRHRTDLLAVRALQRDRLRLPLPEDAGADRPQPRRDRGPPGEEEFKPADFASPKGQASPTTG